MSETCKPAATSIEIQPLRELCIVSATMMQPVTKLSNKDLSENETITWKLVAYGENAIGLDSNLKIGDKVILSQPPAKEGKLNVKSNDRSCRTLMDVYEDMSKTNKVGFDALVKEMQDKMKEDNKELIRAIPKVQVVDYFFIPNFHIGGIDLTPDNEITA